MLTYECQRHVDLRFVESSHPQFSLPDPVLFSPNQLRQLGFG